MKKVVPEYIKRLRKTIPPRGRPHSTKKGARGYSRIKNKKHAERQAHYEI